MALSLRSVAAIALVLPLIAWKCGPDDGDTPPETTDAAAPDGGGGGDPDPANDGGAVDAGGGQDGEVANDAGQVDASEDAGSDASGNGDADTDAGRSDAGNDRGVDAAPNDAGTPYIVFLCFRSFGGTVTTQMIDSEGNRWSRGLVAVKAGDPVPAGTSKWPGAAPVVDLPNLLAAAAAMKVSTAGSKTTSCTIETGYTRISSISTAAGPGDAPVTVARFYNSEKNPPVDCSRTITNDPAWQELRKYNCAMDIDSTSHPW